MKTIFLFGFLLICSTLSLAQKGTYIKYKMSVQPKTDEMEMVVMMMEGSTMEIAMSESRNYVSNKIGDISNSEVEVNLTNNMMTMYLSGMMGEMAFRGKTEEITSEDDKDDLKVIYAKDKKRIQGYKCRLAKMVDEKGNESQFWYTTKIKRPEGANQMPNELPGLCLEMILNTEEMEMTYRAIEVKKKTDISVYALKIPEGVEIKTF